MNKNKDKSSNFEKAMIKMNFVRDTIMKEESIIGKKNVAIYAMVKNIQFTTAPLILKKSS